MRGSVTCGREHLPQHAQARTLEASGLRWPYSWQAMWPAARAVAGILRIWASDHVEQDRHVGHRARHRAGRVAHRH